MDEFQFIQSVTPKFYRQPNVMKGIGDDAAIIRNQHEDTILTVDTMVDMIHFSLKTTKPYHIGYRALAANISDIAAMGGKPTSFLVSIVIPDDWQDQQLNEIYQGMKDLAKNFQMDLIGGDTVSGKQLTLTITVIGSVPQGRARYRSQAKQGDIVFVTGTLGDSACGLHILLHGNENEHDNYEYFIKRHQMPMPRVDFIQACQGITRMALNDISDGIANEANEIALASNQLIELDYNKIPCQSDLYHFSEADRSKWILSGGEDFELIGTIPANEWDILRKVAKETNTKISQIGVVKNNPEKNGSVWIYQHDRYAKLNKSGYTHLSR